MKQIPAALLKEYLEYRERGSCCTLASAIVPLEDMPREMVEIVHMEAMLYRILVLLHQGA